MRITWICALLKYSSKYVSLIFQLREMEDGYVENRCIQDWCRLLAWSTILLDFNMGTWAFCVVWYICTLVRMKILRSLVVVFKSRLRKFPLVILWGRFLIVCLVIFVCVIFFSCHINAWPWFTELHLKTLACPLIIKLSFLFSLLLFLIDILHSFFPKSW